MTENNSGYQGLGTPRGVWGTKVPWTDKGFQVGMTENSGAG